MSRGGETILDRKRREAAAKRPDRNSPEVRLQTSQSTPKKSAFAWQDSADFLAGDYRAEWLVSKVLVKNQPGVIAGPSKGMKTSLLVDLAVSMATRHEFLNTFDVPKQAKVAIVSGESGQHTLKETCLRILRAKGLDSAALAGWLSWEFKLPTFSDAIVMADFATSLADVGAEVVLIDPTYLALGRVDATNLFDMGSAFRVVAESLLSRGVTPILVHHANRQLPSGEPMELQHLAYSGLEQFARQFILLNRREKYSGDGVHDLWLRVGGSAGQGGLWALKIEEGQLDEDFGGREWSVKVQTTSELDESRGRERESRKREQALAKSRAEQQAVMTAIDSEHAGGRDAPTKSRLKDLTGLSTERINQAIAALIGAGLVETTDVKATIGNGAQRPATGFRRAEK